MLSKILGITGENKINYTIENIPAENR